MVNLKIEPSIYSCGRRLLPAAQWYRLSDDALHIHERRVEAVLCAVCRLCCGSTSVGQQGLIALP